mmetsp:Transcript_27230/g.76948  ORF Transcript_27230/g.76948 Transcript_27230/m.76948 type:complete len:292 (-) Transcript_27230:280-1155(-)
MHKDLGLPVLLMGQDEMDQDPSASQLSLLIALEHQLVLLHDFAVQAHGGRGVARGLRVAILSERVLQVLDAMHGRQLKPLQGAARDAPRLLPLALDEDRHFLSPEVVPAEIHVAVLYLLDVFDPSTADLSEWNARRAYEQGTMLGFRRPVPKTTDGQVDAQVVARQPVREVLDDLPLLEPALQELASARCEADGVSGGPPRPQREGHRRLPVVGARVAQEQEVEEVQPVHAVKADEDAVAVAQRRREREGPRARGGAVCQRVKRQARHGEAQNEPLQEQHPPVMSLVSCLI